MITGEHLIKICQEYGDWLEYEPDHIPDQYKEGWAEGRFFARFGNYHFKVYVNIRPQPLETFFQVEAEGYGVLFDNRNNIYQNGLWEALILAAISHPVE